MKKAILILAIMLICLLPGFSAYAQNGAMEEDNFFITDTELESLEHADSNNTTVIASTGLITYYNLSIAKNGSDLIL